MIVQRGDNARQDFAIPNEVGGLLDTIWERHRLFLA